VATVAIALAGGSLAVAWAGGVARDGRTVPIQTTAVFGLFADDQRNPAVAVAPDGAFAIAAEVSNVSSPIAIIDMQPGGNFGNGSFGGFAAGDANPAITFVKDGGMRLVWQTSSSPGDDVDLAIVGGSDLYPSEQINLHTTGLQQLADVAAGPGGDHIVVWQSGSSAGDDSSLDSIQALHFAADGTPGPQFQVNSYTPAGQYFPSVAVRDGGFVVAWYGTVEHDADGFGVAMRLLDQDGVPTGDDIPVNVTTTGFQTIVGAAGDPSGRFAVVWGSPASAGSDSDGSSVQARYFDSDGSPLSNQVQVNTHTFGDQARPAVAATGDGSFIVVWESTDLAPPDTSVRGIRGRWVTLGGGGLGDDDFQVNTYTTGNQRDPAVATDRDGNAIVVWESDGAPDNDASVYTIQQRRLARAGDLTDGLVAYWSFDELFTEVAEDRVGSLDGTLHNVYRDSGLAKFRNDVSFTAEAGAYIDLSGVGPEHAISGPGVTIAGWVNLDLLPSQIAESYAGIFDAVNDNYVLYLDKVAQELRFKVTNSLGTAARPGIPESLLATGKWVHVAGVFDGDAAEARIYLEGVLVEVLPLSGNVRSSPEQIPAFGRNGSGGTASDDSYYFSGDLDDFAIWNRALSTEEIRYLRSNEIFADGFEVDISLWSSAVGL